MIRSWVTFQSHLVSSVSHLFQWNKHPPLGNFTTDENTLKMLRFWMDCAHCVHLWKYGCGHSCLRSNLVLGSGWPQRNTEDRALSQILVALRKERLLNFSDKNECAQAPEVGEFRPLCLPSLLAAKKIKGERKIGFEHTESWMKWFIHLPRSWHLALTHQSTLKKIECARKGLSAPKEGEAVAWAHNMWGCINPCSSSYQSIQPSSQGFPNLLDLLFICLLKCLLSTFPRIKW